MASITIRQLDEGLKRRLRLRAARNGRSMEDEARTILRHAAERAFPDRFDPQSEFDIGHIRLAREADLIVLAPATADLMAKLAGGHADDLASAVLLATDRAVLVAPAMNPRMWEHKATRRN